jgi:hypothetical protein
LIGAAFILVGVFLTFGAFRFRPDNDILASALVLAWGAVLHGGTYLLPASVTVPYDPLGHPALHVLGIVANAIYLGAAAFAIWTFIRWVIRRP